MKLKHNTTGKAAQENYAVSIFLFRKAFGIGNKETQRYIPEECFFLQDIYKNMEC
jgi:hypothetical protein